MNCFSFDILIFCLGTFLVPAMAQNVTVGPNTVIRCNYRAGTQYIVNHVLEEPEEAPVPAGFVKVPYTHKAMLIDNHEWEWYISVDRCVNRGGRLAVLRSEIERDFVMEKFNLRKRTRGPWLGLFTLESEWLTIKAESLDRVNYAPWAYRPILTAGGKYCANINGNGMESLNCTEFRGMLCEVDLRVG